MPTRTHTRNSLQHDTPLAFSIAVHRSAPQTTGIRNTLAEQRLPAARRIYQQQVKLLPLPRPLIRSQSCHLHVFHPATQQIFPENSAPTRLYFVRCVILQRKTRRQQHGLSSRGSTEIQTSLRRARHGRKSRSLPTGREIQHIVHSRFIIRILSRIHTNLRKQDILRQPGIPLPGLAGKRRPIVFCRSLRTQHECTACRIARLHRTEKNLRLRGREFQPFAETQGRLNRESA